MASSKARVYTVPDDQRVADVRRRLDLLIADARRARAEEDERIVAMVAVRKAARA